MRPRPAVIAVLRATHTLGPMRARARAIHKEATGKETALDATRRSLSRLEAQGLVMVESHRVRNRHDRQQTNFYALTQMGLTLLQLHDPQKGN